MFLLASSNTTRGFGGSYGVVGTSHHTAGFLEGWQETGPLNPHCSPHPELGLPWFTQGCSSPVLSFVWRTGCVGWKHQQVSLAAAFPAGVQEMPLGLRQLVGLSENPAQIAPCKDAKARVRFWTPFCRQGIATRLRQWDGFVMPLLMSWRMESVRAPAQSVPCQYCSHLQFCFCCWLMLKMKYCWCVYTFVMARTCHHILGRRRLLVCLRAICVVWFCCCLVLCLLLSCVCVCVIFFYFWKKGDIALHFKCYDSCQGGKSPALLQNSLQP